MVARIEVPEVREALTFDDVLLVPAYSEVLPAQTDVRSRLTRSIALNTPLLAAAMDTVTEADTAICMARNGGLGVIHKNLSPTQQAHEVRKVKKSQSGMVVEPIAVSPDMTLEQALGLMRQHGISGLPVVSERKPIGILTSRDVRFETNFDQRVGDVMTREPITVEHGIALSEAKKVLHRHRIEKLLVVDAEGLLLGLITVKDIVKAESHPHAIKDSAGRLRVAAAVGTGADTMERVSALVDQSVDLVVVDTAHGHSRGVINMVSCLRKEFPDLQIAAGNIATPEAVEALAKA
ncbi:MAG: IMP dehydrogenase, partial [Nannocystaceae bacterium]